MKIYTHDEKIEIINALFRALKDFGLYKKFLEKNKYHFLNKKGFIPYVPADSAHLSCFAVNYLWSFFKANFGNDFNSEINGSLLVLYFADSLNDKFMAGTYVVPQEFSYLREAIGKNGVKKLSKKQFEKISYFLKKYKKDIRSSQVIFFTDNFNI